MRGYDYWDFLALLFAVFLGAVIGLERELNGKAAGLRTNVLICLGACVFTILSRLMADASVNSDQSRIAAQIVSGVGFIGAGVIIRDNGGVHGITTAAGIWMVASIGVACGSHYFIFATVATLIAFLCLIVLQPISRLLRRFYSQRHLSGEINCDPNKQIREYKQK